LAQGRPPLFCRDRLKLRSGRPGAMQRLCFAVGLWAASAQEVTKPNDAATKSLRGSWTNSNWQIPTTPGQGGDGGAGITGGNGWTDGNGNWQIPSIPGQGGDGGEGTTGGNGWTDGNGNWQIPTIPGQGGDGGDGTTGGNGGTEGNSQTPGIPGQGGDGTTGGGDWSAPRSRTPPHSSSRLATTATPSGSRRRTSTATRCVRCSVSSRAAKSSAATRSSARSTRISTTMRSCTRTTTAAFAEPQSALAVLCCTFDVLPSHKQNLDDLPRSGKKLWFFSMALNTFVQCSGFDCA